MSSHPWIRPSIKRALAWKTYRTLLDHHPDLDLFIMETHPGGGQYDCLTLVQLPRFRDVCWINLVGDSVRFGAPFDRPTPTEPVEPEPHVVLALGANPEGLAQRIEATLGFPDRRPVARTPRCLALAVIGTLLDRVALGSKEIELRSGWFDTSGMEDSGVRTWAQALPGVAEVPEHADWRVAARACGRYWSLDRNRFSEAPAVIVDVVSGALWLHGVLAKDLPTRFAAGHGVRDLAWTLEQAVDGGAKG